MRFKLRRAWPSSRSQRMLSKENEVEPRIASPIPVFKAMEGFRNEQEITPMKLMSMKRLDAVQPLEMDVAAELLDDLWHSSNLSSVDEVDEKEESQNNDVARKTVDEVNRRLFNAVGRDGASVSEVNQLFSEGAEVNCVDEETGNTPLHLCARLGNKTLTTHFLWQRRARTDILNKEGKAAFDIASEETHEVFFEEKIDQMFECARRDDVEVLKGLMQHLESENMLKIDLLERLYHVAAKCGSTKTATLLLDDFEVHLDARSETKRTALHFAVESNSYEMIRMILERGADIEAQDANGIKPFDVSKDRITQRIIRKVEKTREKSSSEKSLTSIEKFVSGPNGEASLRDFFATSPVLVDAVAYIDYDLDAENLHNEHAIVSEAKYAKVVPEATSVADFAVFCNEALSTFLLEANKTIALAKSEKKTLKECSSNEEDEDFLEEHCLDECESTAMKRESSEDVRVFSDPKFFPFVVTNNEGERSFLSILCFVDFQKERNGNPLGRCICMVSRIPAFMTQKMILCDLVACEGGKEVTADSILESILGKEFGKPGIELDIGTRVVRFDSESAQGLPMIDDSCFDALFSCLQPSDVALIVSALLTEQSVLLLSDHPHLLTLVSSALIALLFPFEWHHPFIPILPQEMLHIIENPFSFLVGIHSSYFEQLSAECLCSLMIINLDRGSVVAPIDPEKASSCSSSVGVADSPLVTDAKRLTKRSLSSQSLCSMMLPRATRLEIEQAIFDALPPMRCRMSVREIAMELGGDERHSKAGQVKAPPHRSSLSWADAAAFHMESREVLSPLTCTSNNHHNAIANDDGMKTAKYLAFRGSKNNQCSRASMVPSVRSSCVDAFVTLLRDLGDSHFDIEAQEAFQKQRDNLWDAQFFEAFFRTQLWQTFKNEVRFGAPSKRRDGEIAHFFNLVDIALGNEEVNSATELHSHENQRPDDLL